MILESIILKENTSFVDEEGENLIFCKGERFGCETDCEGNIFFISEDGKKYKSNDSRLPIKVSNQFKTVRPTLFYVIDPISKTIIETKYVQGNTYFTRNENGKYICGDFGEKVELDCDNEENLKVVLVYPSTKIKAEVEAEETEKKKVIELNPNAKYCGDDGIDTAILFLQTADLSKLIVRDDSTHTLFVDLGSTDMWPDVDNADWIMKLNARIPLASACSVGKRFVKGKPRLAVILNSSFV